MPRTSLPLRATQAISLVCLLMTAGVSRADEPPPPADSAAPAPPANSAAPTPPPGDSVAPTPPPADSVAPTPPPGDSVAPSAAPASSAAPAAPLESAPPGEVSDSPAPEILRWAGTNLGWGTSASNQYFGIGSQTIGTEDYSVFTSFAVSGGVFVLRRPEHKLRVSTSIGFDLELTNSNTTTTKNEAVFRDIPLSVTYTGTVLTIGDGDSVGGMAALRDPTLIGRGDHRTWVRAGLTLDLPTSKYSQAVGLDTTLGLGVRARQQVRLRGGDAIAFTHLLASVSAGLTHPFYRTKQATGPIGRAGVGSLPPDVGSTHTENIVGVGFRVTLPILRDLQLDTGLSWARIFKYAPTSTGCIQLASGCVEPSPDPAASNELDYTTFDVGLSYLIIRELGVEIGYANSAYVLGANGEQRDPFYSPNAVFYTDVVFSFDRVYERIFVP